MVTEQPLTVGAITLTSSKARTYVEDYTEPVPDERPSKNNFYAWPYYDGFVSGVGQNELSDGDLLTPVLLNVNPGIHGFAGLQKIRPTLEDLLRNVPHDVDLAAATDTDIEAVARMFGVLDNSPVLGVRGTTLSKVLHRKRPRLIPLHDRHVRAAYVPSPIPPAKGRSWITYMTLLMQAMRNDLAECPDVWAALSAIPSKSDAVLTDLRVLDIVAWSTGKRGTRTV